MKEEGDLWTNPVFLHYDGRRHRCEARAEVSGLLLALTKSSPSPGGRREGLARANVRDKKAECGCLGLGWLEGCWLKAPQFLLWGDENVLN